MTAVLRKRLPPPIMLDVIIALAPTLVVACMAYGSRGGGVIAACVLSCVVAELAFSRLLIGKKSDVANGSSLITGILLACTLSPLTPWYAAAFAGACAILFGKIIWGGLGKNPLNPALVGREFASVFFATTLNSPAIWRIKAHAVVAPADFFDSALLPQAAAYFNKWLYYPAGALGEYSGLALTAGGLYLIVRKRISWHIPATAIAVLIALVWLTPHGYAVRFSLGGLLLGLVFMATDVGTCPANKYAKIFYAAAIGALIFIFIKCGESYAYMSYSILILNAFSVRINRAFTGERAASVLKQALALAPPAANILCAALAVICLKRYGLESFLVYVFIAYAALHYCNLLLTKKSRTKQPT